MLTMGCEGVTAVFVDRDGVINRNRADYVKSPAEFEPFTEALAGIARLAREGWPVIVISNQQCVGKGIISQATLDAITQHMLSAVREAGGEIRAVYYCPHLAEDGCDCRKPGTASFEQAAAEHGINLERSYFIGDSEEDMLAARRAHVTPILVLTGRADGPRDDWAAMPEYVADNFSEAVDWIEEEEE
jgi:D-glycero-D-manno-heptose 1,7-bisphosphate phosphatase